MVERSYAEGIRRAYIGELIGERLYRTLARQWNDADCSKKLAAIADVEALTHRELKTIAGRLGIELVETELQDEVERYVAELGQLSWPELLERAASEWPSYISEYAALAGLPPPGDEVSLGILVDHERALVEFVRLERANIGSMASL